MPKREAHIIAAGLGAGMASYAVHLGDRPLWVAGFVTLSVVYALLSLRPKD